MPNNKYLSNETNPILSLCLGKVLKRGVCGFLFEQGSFVFWQKQNSLPPNNTLLLLTGFYTKVDKTPLSYLEKPFNHRLWFLDYGGCTKFAFLPYREVTFKMRSFHLINIVFTLDFADSGYFCFTTVRTPYNKLKPLPLCFLSCH